jgi:hypothetical protein
MLFYLAMVWTVQDRFLGRGGVSACGAISTAPFQTGPGAHGVSYKVGTGLFTGVKQPGPVGNDTPQLSAEVKNQNIELCQYSPTVPSWPVVR